MVHYARNLLGMVDHANRKELGEDLRASFAAPALEPALEIASSVAEKWRQKGYEKVSEHLEEHVEECLSCLAFPEPHRRRIRTTNGQERLNQEIKRRTRVVRIFPNPQACLKLVTALDRSTELLNSPSFVYRELERDIDQPVFIYLVSLSSRRAVRGVGDGQALPGHARARRAPSRRTGSERGGTRGELAERRSLEEITELSGYCWFIQ